MPKNSPYLNVGCGARFHSDWVNVDIRATSPEVVEHDMRSGLPFESGAFLACYHSHVLEHFEPSQGARLLAECARVLAPGGVLRVVVPDLEGIARAYLTTLERAEAGYPGAEHDHTWMTIELLDQSVRQRSGGAMADYLRLASLPNREFVAERMGMEAEGWWAPPAAAAVRGVRRLNGAALRRATRRLTDRLRTRAIRTLFGDDTSKAYELGAFREAGEIHQWMYDRNSLRAALLRSGFHEIRVTDAFESWIPDFGRFELDAIEGRVRKPDSLFMEARKP
jgi:predicted SAM-dependent methyltransferase